MMLPVTRTAAQEAAEDVFFGQIVIIWERWFFVAAAAVLALTMAWTRLEMMAATLLAAGLMAVNFFIHARYLMERPANRRLIMATVGVDIVAATLLVLDWRGQGGLNSQLYILYYPILLAFGLVFPPRTTLRYTCLVLGLYTAACLVRNPFFLFTLAGFEAFAMRAITLAAMSGLGTLYWRLQRPGWTQALKAPSVEHTA